MSDEKPTPTRKYTSDLWTVDKFVQSWAKHSHYETWAEFWSAMNNDCNEVCGLDIPPVQLQARLRICTKHLANKGYQAPPFPKRPKKVPPPTLADAVALAGLQKIPGWKPPKAKDAET